MICPKCGSTLPEEARFCNICGGNTTQLEAEPLEQKDFSRPRYKVEARGAIRKLTTKIVAAVAIGGVSVALLWTPFIQPILLSKTIGPEDLTGYRADLEWKKSVVDSTDFPNGKWVREDGKAVLYIAHMEKEETFDFELYVDKQDLEEACQVKAEAHVDSSFEANEDVKAVAKYEGEEGENELENLHFLALATEDAIEVVSGPNWSSAQEEQVLPDGKYYRSTKVWFWENREGGNWSLQFIFDKDGGIRVDPPPIQPDGKTPKRVQRGGLYMSEEWMRRLVEAGFYLELEGVYYTIDTTIRDYDKFVNYYFYEVHEPDKDKLVGMQQGLQVAQARADSLEKMKNSCYGKTNWIFTADASFIPDFNRASLQYTGKFAEQVDIPGYQLFRVGYEFFEAGFEGDDANNSYQLLWDPNTPYVINVVGGFDVPPSTTELVDKVAYDLNLYFMEDGTVDAEGYLTYYILGTEEITFWVQMSAIAFQPDFEFTEDYAFQSVEYVYEFESLDDDIPEYTVERETDFIDNGERYEYRKYEYETKYQTVE